MKGTDKNFSKNKNILLLLPLFFVILISGCITPLCDVMSFLPGCGDTVTQYKNDIIVIKNLQATPSTNVKSGQTLTIYADIENIEEIGKDPVEVDVRMYDYCRNLFSEPKPRCPEPSPEGDGCTVTMHPKEISTVMWELEPEEVNLKTDCTLRIIVIYNYDTTTVTSISFISRDILNGKIRRGEQWRISGESSVGEGPVKPYLTVESQQPIPTDTDASISLIIENKGNGYVKDSEIKDVDKNIVIDLYQKAKEVFELKFNETDECSFKSLTGENDVSLIKKQTSPLICKVDLKKLNIEEETYKIWVNVNYDYEFRKSIKVSVDKR